MSELQDLDTAPSRSQERRTALAILALARQLVELPPSRVAKLQLPDDMRAEIDQMRRIRSPIARKRQLQFLAKLMRRHGEDILAQARAALGEDRQRQHQETAALHRLEALREQLIEDQSEAVLSAWIEAHPETDRQRLRALIRQARSERKEARPTPKAYRELFRLLQAQERG